MIFKYLLLWLQVFIQQFIRLPVLQGLDFVKSSWIWAISTTYYSRENASSALKRETHPLVFAFSFFMLKSNAVYKRILFRVSHAPIFSPQILFRIIDRSEECDVNVGPVQCGVLLPPHTNLTRSWHFIVFPARWVLLLEQIFFLFSCEMLTICKYSGSWSACLTISFSAHL